MRVSDETLEALANIIVDKTCSDEGGKFVDEVAIHHLIDFFCNMKVKMNIEKPVDAPSTIKPIEYTVEILSQYNDDGKIKSFIEEFLLPHMVDNEWGGFAINQTKSATRIQSYLKKDGYKLIVVRDILELSPGNAFNYSVLDENEFAETPAIEENAKAQRIMEKAKERFTKEDYDGAIASCFTLSETVIKNILKEMGEEYKKNAQFIDLYPQISKALNLNPVGENIESRLKPILQGLKSQVGGLYDLANKASDRHDLEHPPKRQDAKLAINATLTLCEYLRDAHKAHKVVPEEFAKLAKLTGAPGSKTY